ncbi:GNAT family N-acetyltransferase [Enterococcus crotali]|uniref:GNAT family N-acetyltransferase n=1 Tax=Enterococcus crotali TaxID=1453587 RepID=UPI000472FAE6|nr:GNAT family N-acetyltransferase [Enterococcus crotali]
MIIRINKHLKLEEASNKDFVFLKNLYQDKDIQTLALSEDNFDIQDSNIKNTIEFFSNSDDMLFIIKLDDHSIGIVTLYDFSFSAKETKFGIILMEKYQNFSIGIKVFKSIEEYIFSKLHFNRIVSEVIDYNLKVISILKRLGFEFIESKKDIVRKGSSKYDLQVYERKNNVCI